MSTLCSRSQLRKTPRLIAMNQSATLKSASGSFSAAARFSETRSVAVRWSISSTGKFSMSKIPKDLFREEARLSQMQGAQMLLISMEALGEKFAGFQMEIEG